MYCRIVERDKWGLIDSRGHIVINPIYTQLGEYRDGLISFEANGRVGFIDADGETVIDPRFDVCASRMPLFISGLAAVAEKGLFGYIGLKGQWVVPPKWHSCWDFIGDYAIVESPDGYYVIDRVGQQVSLLPVSEIPFGYEWPSDWHCIRCYLQVDGRLMSACTNYRGEIVFAPRYPEMTDFFSGIAGFCETTDHYTQPYGLVTLTGEVRQSPRYFLLSEFVDGLARAARSMKEYGFINTKGEWVIEPKYQQAQPFSNGLACVTVKGRRGFINTRGEMVIEPRFSGEARFQQGFAHVEYEGKRAVIDRSGKVIWQTELERK